MMTDAEFAAVKAWVQSEAKHIASEMIGHHYRTVEDRRVKAAQREMEARRALRVAE